MPSCAPNYAIPLVPGCFNLHRKEYFSSLTVPFSADNLSQTISPRHEDTSRSEWFPRRICIMAAQTTLLLSTQQSVIKCNLGEAIDIRASNSLFSPQKGDRPMQAYCMKCRTKREMKDARPITMKNGKPATQGTCPACGTKMFRIGKS